MAIVKITNMSLLDLCEQYFGFRDVYEVFKIEEKALPKDVKQACYKVLRQVHLDWISKEENETTTEKLKILVKLSQVLSDKDKRALYDKQKIIDDDDDDMDRKFTSWLDLWRKTFKPTSIEQISDYEKSYIGSELERKDIKKAYLSAKGCINQMINEVPCMKVEDEPRIQEIVREMIKDGEVPEYKIFVNEPAQKRKRRHKKYAREREQAEYLKKTALKKQSAQIMERRQAREASLDSFLGKLMEKYGNGDESDVFDLNELRKGGRKKQKKAPKGKKQKKAPNGKKATEAAKGKKQKKAPKRKKATEGPKGKKAKAKSREKEKLHKVANGKVKKRKSK